MSIKIGALLVLAVSAQAYAMEKSSSSEALEGAVAQVVTSYVEQKSEASSSSQVATTPAQEVVKPSSLLVAFKNVAIVSGCTFGGAACGKLAGYYGYVKDERKAVVKCASAGFTLGLAAIGGAGKLKEGVTCVQKYLSKSAPKETK